MNAARVRARRLSGKPRLRVKLDELEYDLGIVIPEGVIDKFTTVSPTFDIFVCT